MNERLEQHVANFIGQRLVGPTLDVHKEKQLVMHKMIDDISATLAATNDTTLGKTALEIHEHIYNVVLEVGCDYEERGYSVGFADGLALAKVISPLTM